MSQQKIIINEPCHEDWNKMQPNAEGRHCLSCCKTVVDFTNWETDDILKYISQSTKSVCGQVRASEVLVPEQKTLTVTPGLLQRIASSPLSLLRKIAAVVALVFGVTHTEVVFAQSKTKKTQQKEKHPKPMIMGGMIAPRNTDTVKVPEPKIVGEIAVPTPDTVVNQPDHNVRGRIAPPEQPSKIKGKIAAPKLQRK